MGKQSRLRRERKEIGSKNQQSATQEKIATTFARRNKWIPPEITIQHGFIDSEGGETIWQAEDFKNEYGRLEAKVVAVGDDETVDLYLIEWFFGCDRGEVQLLENIPLGDLKRVLESEMRYYFQSDYYSPVFEEVIVTSLSGSWENLKKYIERYIEKTRRLNDVVLTESEKG